MVKPIEEFFVPWVKPLKMYVSRSHRPCVETAGTAPHDVE